MHRFTVFVVACVICVALFLVMYGCGPSDPPSWFIPPTPMAPR